MSRKLRVWWVPQVPLHPFYVSVSGIAEAVKIMDILAKYDDFQYKNRIKPDYRNAGGVEQFIPMDGAFDDEYDVKVIEDGVEGYWISWEDEDTGIEDPYEYLAYMKSNEQEQEQDV